VLVAPQAFNPQALSNCLWALVGLRYNPGKRCLGVFASRMQETLCEHTCQVLQLNAGIACCRFSSCTLRRSMFARRASTTNA
jgi:hypothetical protein